MRNLKSVMGITLIALVITIIVLLILAGVTIATLTGDNGLLTKSSSVQFKSDVKQYEEELRLSIHSEEIEALGNRTNVINVPKKYITTGEENENYTTDMVKYIPSFNISKYGNKLEIRNDELVYIDETNSQEREWFGEVKLTLAKMFLKVNYVDKNGNKLAEPETISTTTGRYEIEPKVIEGYEAEMPLYEGKTTQDTEISITYLQESGNLAYIGLDESGNETDDESNIVAYTVSGIGSFTGEDLVIPRKHNENSVIQIKGESFKGNISIKRVIIPETVETIGESAFMNCANIEGAIVNAKTIKRLVFYNCSKLYKMVLGNNVESMRDTMCQRTILSDLTILTEKANVNNENFAVGNTLKEIKVNLDNQKYKVEDGILFSKDGQKIYLYPPGHEGTTYVFDRNIKTIGDSAFLGCNKITNISIPETVETIGESAFKDCANIEGAIVNAKTIKRLVFYNCSKLNNVTFGKNIQSLSGDCIFLNTNLLTNLNYNGTKEEWDAITKVSSWKTGSKIMSITCIDETITF